MEVQALVLPEGALMDTFTITTSDGTTIPVLHGASGTGLYSLASSGTQAEGGPSTFNIISSSEMADGTVTLSLADVLTTQDGSEHSNAELHFVQECDGTLVQVTTAKQRSDDGEERLISSEEEVVESLVSPAENVDYQNPEDFTSANGQGKIVDSGVIQLSSESGEQCSNLVAPDVKQAEPVVSDELVTSYPEQLADCETIEPSADSSGPESLEMHGSEVTTLIVTDGDYGAPFVTAETSGADEKAEMTVVVAEDAELELVAHDGAVNDGLALNGVTKTVAKLDVTGEVTVNDKTHQEEIETFDEDVESAVARVCGEENLETDKTKATDDTVALASEDDDVESAVARACSEESYKTCAVKTSAAVDDAKIDGAAAKLEGATSADVSVPTESVEEDDRLSEGRRSQPLPEEEYDDDDPNTVVIDISNPIPLSQNSIISVNGQKCVLQQTETGQMVAFPVREPTKLVRKRGRPRKNVPVLAQLHKSKVGQPQNDSKESDSNTDDEQEEAKDDVTEKGLVETANEAGEIVKRSARKKRRTAILREYETGVVKLEGSSDDESIKSNSKRDVDEQPRKWGRGRGVRGRRPLYRGRGGASAPVVHQSTPELQTPAKRGRGRPRRHDATVSSVPEPPSTRSFLVQTSDGQTLMIHVPASSLSPGMSLQSVAQGIAESLNAHTLQVPLTPKRKLACATNMDDTKAKSPDAIQKPSATIADSESTAQVSVASLPPNSSDILDPTPENETENDHGCLVNIPIKTDETKFISVLEGDKDIAQGLEANEYSTAFIDSSIKKICQTIASNINESLLCQTELAESTVIPITINSMPIQMISTKDSPVKIGLKTSGDDLEKYKCPKCDQQNFYEKQYQDHIAHHEEVLKCKCCSFLSFEDGVLANHYRDNHPKCICSVCNHTAEYAYIIKRHMYRHNENGAKCEVCGKIYKDLHVLRMHMKMIHTPSDVLFKCPQCPKKFNRKAHLKRHLRTHDFFKKFMCPRCDYRGCERSDIIKHALIHEEPKHICEVCNKTFRHIKNKELHVKRHKGQREYKCGVCDYYGYTFTDIRKHIERKHSNSKAIICQKCGLAFKTDNLLNKHLSNAQCDLFILEQAAESLEESFNDNSKSVDERSELDDKNALSTADCPAGVFPNLQVLSEQTTVSEQQTISETHTEIFGSGQEDSENQLLTMTSENNLFGQHVAIVSDGVVYNQEITMVTKDGQMLNGIVMENEPIYFNENYLSIVSQSKSVIQ